MMEKRLLKIVWNSNQWAYPCERTWNPNLDQNPNIGYEVKNGFVHEDWLFNPNFKLGQYQYGFINGINKLNSQITIVDTIYLFTIHPFSKTWYIVGTISNVERVDEKNYPGGLKKKLKSYRLEMIDQLKQTQANYRKLAKDPYRPNIKFKLSDLELFQEFFPIYDKGILKNYHRTIPYKVNENILELFDNAKLNQNFVFKPSNPLGKKKNYSKQTNSKNIHISLLHQEIEEKLYSYLLAYKVKDINIACDTCSFGGKLADIVVRKSKSDFEIYEIKTDIDFRKSLREAIGQLLDYSSWDSKINVVKIYVVLPFIHLNEKQLEYYNNFKSNLEIDLELIFYDNITEEFIKI
jgi:hypothetical protein